MKVDVTQTLIGYDGEALTQGPSGPDNGKDAKAPTEAPKPILLRDVCINALMNVLKEDESLSGVDKLKADELARRLFHEDAPDLTPEELSQLKDRVGRCYGPIIVGPVFRLLNDPDKPT